jgi:hypothetical protein
LEATSEKDSMAMLESGGLSDPLFLGRCFVGQNSLGFDELLLSFSLEFAIETNAVYQDGSLL